MLELPLDIDDAQSIGEHAPFIFKLVDDSSRQVIESFAVPSTCLSGLHQYDFLLSFGPKSKINLECAIWFNPNRNSMLSILQQNKSMIIAQIGLNNMIGFDDQCKYSCFVELIDKKQSLSKMHSNKTRIDFNKSGDCDWQKINHSDMMQKRCWLHFDCNQCIDLQSLYLFCFDDVISSNDHQIVIKVYKDSPNDHSHSLIGFAAVAIENNSRCPNLSNLSLLDPKTKRELSDKKIDFSLQLFDHQNALELMRYPTPKNESVPDQYQMVSFSLFFNFFFDWNPMLYQHSPFLQNRDED